MIRVSSSETNLSCFAALPCIQNSLSLRSILLDKTKIRLLPPKKDSPGAEVHMQKLMMSLNTFLGHVLSLSKDLKIFLLFLFQEHCSNLILGTMTFKDFCCYWKDMYAFSAYSKTFPQGCFQEFCSQGLIHGSEDSLQPVYLNK